MPNFGRVHFTISYVVDLDNKDMVDEAKQCVFEDVMNAVKHDKVANCIKIKLDPTASEADIPKFLLERPVDDSWISPTTDAQDTPKT